MSQLVLTWCIVGVATAGVIVRPFRWPEASWAVCGALLVVVLGLLPLSQAWSGVLKGSDVYMFLTGMMLLSELAREQGLFDWFAALAVARAKGSARRLFALSYAVAILVTIFLSNDATAVVLTPAIYAATRASKVSNPLPYLLTCAFVANAASFVLPISNPANLVVFAAHRMPTLLTWLATFTIPSVVAVTATYFVLRATQAKVLQAETVAADIGVPVLSSGGRIAGTGILATAAVLLSASALGVDLGFPTLMAGIACTIVVLCVTQTGPLRILRNISWGVIPLVAGLFVLVEALNRTGMTQMIARASHSMGAWAPHEAAWFAGVAVALITNIANNLPVGLVAGSALQQAGASHAVSAAILIGVDLGPNLSVTGSLATILWLGALRREGLGVSTWQFLKLGALVMPCALAPTLGALLLASFVLR